MWKEWMGLGGEGKRQTKLPAFLLKIRIQKTVNWISWSVVRGHKIQSWRCEEKIFRSRLLAPWRWVHITDQLLKKRLAERTNFLPPRHRWELWHNERILARSSEIFSSYLLLQDEFATQRVLNEGTSMTKESTQLRGFRKHIGANTASLKT